MINVSKYSNILISNLFRHKEGLTYEEISEKILPFYSEYGIDHIITMLKKEGLVKVEWDKEGYIKHVKLYRFKLKQKKPKFYNILKYN